MKKLIAFLLVLLCCGVTAFAADGTVTYSGNAGSFVFAPGSDHSLTDLFPDFKGVMPGDTLTQKITVKNNADNQVKVKIYMRALGAHEDSVAFLSQLGLQVRKSSDNEMAYMFDAAAGETAQLTDWVYLGMLYSGGEVDLDVTLQVPASLDNTFQSTIGCLDWEFMIEEFSVEDSDPEPPLTGDSAPIGLLTGAMAVSVAGIAVLLICCKKRKKS